MRGSLSLHASLLQPYAGWAETVVQEALQQAHMWALLLEAGCPPAAPLPELAKALASLEQQRTWG